jgi:hypothetical protein
MRPCEYTGQYRKKCPPQCLKNGCLKYHPGTAKVASAFHPLRGYCKQKRKPAREGGRFGAEGRNRTADTAIFSRMLYQLSYLGVAAPTGLEPAISHVTGGCVNQLHHGALGFVPGRGASDRAFRIIAGALGCVKLDLDRGLRLPPDAEGHWGEKPPGGPGGIGLPERFLPDGRILYMGEGRRGHQAPMGGNLRLLLAHREGRPLGFSSGRGLGCGGTWGATGWRGGGTPFWRRKGGTCTGSPLRLVNAKEAFQGEVLVHQVKGGADGL